MKFTLFMFSVILAIYLAARIVMQESRWRRQQDAKLGKSDPAVVRRRRLARLSFLAAFVGYAGMLTAVLVELPDNSYCEPKGPIKLVLTSLVWAFILITVSYYLKSARPNLLDRCLASLFLAAIWTLPLYLGAFMVSFQKCFVF